MKSLEPLDINGMVIPNRYMVPAMVTRLSGSDGFVNKNIVDRYARYAEGEVGLIVVEAMAVHGAKSGPLLRISEDKFTPGLADLVKAVHDNSDSKVVPQIIHFMKLARSGWRQKINMLSEEEIEEIIEQFGDAVVRAREAGFDGVELHSAHAYTLASFISRLNPIRSGPFSGKTLEGRLHMFSRVMENIRKKVGNDFPVGVRFLSEEFIKDGYTVEEAKLIALRFAQCGADYISLSVGGKFEDAVHKPGEILYPYTGYSGDRCMPGAWYPAMTHVKLAGAIKKFINSKGYQVPVSVAGKIWIPEQAEHLIADGIVDIVAMARALLADPDWPKKVRLGEADRIIECDYCNVCKQLDATHKDVTCYLWPKGALQAPSDVPTDDAPSWGADEGGLSVELTDGTAALTWSKVEGKDMRYYVCRADDEGDVRVVDALKTNRHNDRTILAGIKYRYYVRAFDSAGRSSPPSNRVTIEPSLADYVETPVEAHEKA